MLKEIKKCNFNTDIDVVYWNKNDINSNKYEVEDLSGVNFIPRSTMTERLLLDLLTTTKPDILYISGWQDNGYVDALKKYRKTKNQSVTVCGIDDQWHGTLRQRLGKIYFSLFYRKLYDFMWVAGKPQYHYAQRFGYGPERIVSNIYSADTSSFNNNAGQVKRFIFVGRFVPVKGLDILFAAYESLPENTKKEWPLLLIGDGGLKSSIEKHKSKYIDIKPYMQITELRAELLKGGVACIPSRKDQWGLPIHEMAMLGYPLVLSSACGASTEFLISAYNGYLFRTGDKNSLHQALIKITQLSTQELELFSKRSRILANRINSELAANSFLSIMDLKDL
jgi:glycosyltransferase involved in cell wall biosynthesis